MGVRYVSSFADDDDSKCRLKRYYNNLKSNVKTVVQRMQASVNSLDNIKSNFTNYYGVDGSEADSNNIDIARKELETRIRYLTNRVIPEINRKMRNLD